MMDIGRVGIDQSELVYIMDGEGYCFKWDGLHFYNYFLIFVICCSIFHFSTMISIKMQTLGLTLLADLLGIF